MNNFKEKFSKALHGRSLPATAVTVILIASVMLLNMILYTIGQNYQLYLRFDKEEDLSISDASDKNFEDAVLRGDKVTVTFCMYRDVIENHSTGKLVLNTAEEFAEKYPELITLRFVNIITQLDERGNFIDTAPYEAFSEEYGVPLSRYSVIFECGNKVRVLTDTYTSAGFADFFTFDSSGSVTSYSGEETFASMINYVMQSDEPKYAYFTTGHSEMPSVSLYSVLTRAGYIVEEINLRKVDKIPDNAGLVVISNPISDFERAAEGSKLHSEIERLRDYAERGGNFLVTLDPVASATPVLYSFLAEFGFAPDRTSEGESHIVKDTENGITTDGFTLVASYADGDVPLAVKEKTDIGGGNIIIRYVSSLTLSGAARPLLLASRSAVTEAGGDTVNTDGSYVVAGYSELECESGSTASMVVVPSVYLTATDAIVTNGYANKDFIYALCETLFEADSMTYGCTSYVYNDTVLENLTMGTAKVYTAVAIAIPVVIAALGAVLIIRRKNR
ncbi:MAG: Gldg family protein [Clostridia bacterium]|nr:Gldg family protein [Clostridia bacterium]